MPAKATSISNHFKELKDPRVETRSRHLLVDILTIALCSIIAGADSFTDMELFGKTKKAWLDTFLELPGGIPSHDTFNRVFSALSPEQFSKCFVEWVRALATQVEGVVAIDGKTLRRSFDSASKKGPLHMVSAWSSANELVLGQIRTAAKSNEITAIPELLKMLDLEGSIVTIDAMGCQKTIAQTIVESRADYVLALKGNQGNTLDAVQHLFSWEEKNDYNGVSHTEYRTVEKDHGRIETRHVISMAIPEEIDVLHEWPELKSITMVVSKREVLGKPPTEERRFYLSSLQAEAEILGSAVRSHWGIENSLHWSLDVTFREDLARNRKGHSAENMAIIRHMVLNLLKKEKSSKSSLRMKRLRASWDDDYILKLIATF